MRLMERRRDRARSVLLEHALGQSAPLLRQVHEILPDAVAGYAGDVRRGLEVVEVVDLVVATSSPRMALLRLMRAVPGLRFGRAGEGAYVQLADVGARVRVVGPHDLGREMLERTGTPAFVEAVLQRLKAARAADARYGSEAALFRAAGLPFIPPEARETPESIELAREGRLALVEPGDLTAVLHVHTDWSDGAAAVEQVARRARDLGYQVIGVADHSRSARHARGLSVDDLARQVEHVREVDAGLEGIRVLAGVECDILPDGALDYPDPVLAGLDFVIASVHDRLKQDAHTMTRRVLRAVEHPAVRILAHPTGRLLLNRPPLALHLDAVMAHAVAHDTALEVNANAYRLDLDWRHLPKARELGLRLALGADAHDLEALDVFRGVHVLRKGLVTPRQVVNTWSTDELVAWLHPRL